jgi:hypothetical protein
MSIMMIIMYPYRYNIACMRNLGICTSMCRRGREGEKESGRDGKRPALSLLRAMKLLSRVLLLRTEFELETLLPSASFRPHLWRNVLCRRSVVSGKHGNYGVLFVYYSLWFC